MQADDPDGASFPSGDTMAGASIAFGLLMTGFPPIPCWLLAFVAGFGRVYYWYHYVGDAIAGAAVSYAAAAAVSFVFAAPPQAWHVGLYLPVFVAVMKLIAVLM